MNYLKDTNIQAYNQIDVELSKLTISTIEILHKDSNLIVNWKCDKKIYSRIGDNIEHRFHCFECNHTWNIIWNWFYAGTIWATF